MRNLVFPVAFTPTERSVAAGLAISSLRNLGSVIARKSASASSLVCSFGGWAPRKTFTARRCDSVHFTSDFSPELLLPAVWECFLAIFVPFHGNDHHGAATLSSPSLTNRFVNVILESSLNSSGRSR